MSWWFFQTRVGKILSHSLVWAGVIVLPLVLRELVLSGAHLPKVLIGPTSANEWLVVLSFQLVMIVFFYLNSWKLVPELLWKRRFNWYFLAVFGAWVVIFVAFCTIQNSGLLPEDNFFKEKRYFGMTLLFLIFWFASLGHCMTLAWFRMEKDKRDMENEKLKTELSFLQGQVNPHFLFNTLNTIYSLAHQKSERTPGAVLQLSNLLRYVLETPMDRVWLAAEIRHLEDLIALHQLRLTHKTRVSMAVTGNPDGISIAPMIFLPFVENAFKYGVSAHKESDICFLIVIEKERVVFESSNTNYHLSDADTRTTGIGIPNVRRRLELLYPGKHELYIGDDGAIFRVRLEIELNHV